MLTNCNSIFKILTILEITSLTFLCSFYHYFCIPRNLFGCQIKNYFNFDQTIIYLEEKLFSYFKINVDHKYEFQIEET